MQADITQTGSFDNLRASAFYEDPIIPAQEPKRDYGGGDALVQLVRHISDTPNLYHKLCRDKAAWSNDVYSLVMQLFVHDMFDRVDQHLADFSPCTNAKINPIYHRFARGMNPTDFVVRILSQNDLTASYDQPAACLNWVADKSLQSFPLAFGVSVTPGGGCREIGRQQLGIWHAAQWEHLLAVGGNASQDIKFTPGIIVTGTT